MVLSRSHLPGGFPPAGPAVEHTSPRPCDSSAGRGCSPRPLQPLESHGPSTPAAPWLAFTRLDASQTWRFERLKGCALSTRFLPWQVDLAIQLNDVAPSLQRHDSAFLTPTGDSAPVPRLGTLTLVGPPRAFLPCQRGDRFPRSTHQPGPWSRRLPAGRRLGSMQVPPRLLPESRLPPVLTSSLRFRHVFSGSLALVSVALT
jgi:hypothetical protein